MSDDNGTKIGPFADAPFFAGNDGTRCKVCGASNMQPCSADVHRKARELAMAAVSPTETEGAATVYKSLAELNVDMAKALRLASSLIGMMCTTDPGIEGRDRRKKIYNHVSAVLVAVQGAIVQARVDDGGQADQCALCRRTPLPGAVLCFSCAQQILEDER